MNWGGRTLPLPPDRRPSERLSGHSSRERAAPDSEDLTASGDPRSPEWLRVRPPGASTGAPLLPPKCLGRGRPKAKGLGREAGGRAPSSPSAQRERLALTGPPAQQCRRPAPKPGSSYLPRARRRRRGTSTEGHALAHAPPASPARRSGCAGAERFRGRFSSRLPVRPRRFRAARGGRGGSGVWRAVRPPSSLGYSLLSVEEVAARAGGRPRSFNLQSGSAPICGLRKSLRV